MMMTRKSILVLLLFFFMMPTAYADWAVSFVVYSGNSYVISDAFIDEANIGGRIGQVTSYSDKEGTYSGNFSNVYPVGTAYYKIKGLDISEAIAIKTKDGYLRCDYNGEYPGKVDLVQILAFFFVIFLFFIRWYNLQNKKQITLQHGKRDIKENNSNKGKNDGNGF